MSIELTEADIANGWTAETLAQYRAERDEAAGLVAGFVVTERKPRKRRERPPLQVQNSRSFNPNKWGR